MEAGEEPGVSLRSFRVLEELVGGLMVGISWYWRRQTRPELQGPRRLLEMEG